jgi:isoquinoline 1-oxidoreductase alpha subunit
MAISLTVNGSPVTLDADPDMPLLWALRDELRLTHCAKARHFAQVVLN